VGYLVIDALASVLVGGCGFKGNPAPDGSVEIAYGTFAPFRARGFATAMALELVGIARASGKVTCVIAHTLPERNASAKVLSKAGFRHVGEVTDPEDGRVWQWRRDLAEGRAAQQGDEADER
jgi:RimJ/RimL family protein N-acetyltransferase